MSAPLWDRTIAVRRVTRPRGYGPADPPRGSDTAAWKPVTIAGNINEALDIWAHAKPMPELREGDRIAFLNAGGYGAAMSSNHCMRGDFTEMLLPG